MTRFEFVHLRRQRKVIGLLALLALAGCTTRKNEDFTPASGNARSALESALNSWKAGQPPGTVAGTSKPAVQAVDTEWQNGLKLTEFEILADEGASGPGPRTFKVLLKPAGGKPLEVKYMVIGIDPLWVYRDKDFDKLAGS